MKKRNLAIFASILIFTLSGLVFAYQHKKNQVTKQAPATKTSDTIEYDYQAYAGDLSLVGPGGNAIDTIPGKEDLKLFAIPVPGILSRSGQPTLAGFEWLKKNGWKSVVDFREDMEKENPYAIDSKLPGFDNLGLNFLSLIIKDGGNFKKEQADQFLKFVTSPENQPVHIHCAAGIGRTGVATALYRYSVQGWSMNKAIEESSLFTKIISKSQRDWLQKWAKDNLPGSYAR